MNYLVQKAHDAGLFCKMRKPINLAAFCGQNDIAAFIKHLSHRGNICHSLLSPFDGRQHTIEIPESAYLIVVSTSICTRKSA